MHGAISWWRGLRTSARRLNLALQGGGAHGAFTWGVLDTLLADPRVQFEGLSGSSAGAINAVVLADGWIKGGRDGARQALADFWTRIGQRSAIALVTQGDGETIALSPAGRMLANWLGYFSPAQLNPLDLNPLRELIEDQVDFERLRACSPFKLFIAATQANTGRLRIFREGELTTKALLASTCLPRIHHSVEIDGEPYWDGGYSANPAVFPLFYECDSSDVLLVLLSPLRHEATPRSVQDIETRVLELAFSSHFMREMRMFYHAAEFSASALLPLGRLERRLRKMRFHMVDASQLTSMLRAETRLLAHGPFLDLLRAQGAERATGWLREHFDSVARRSTIDTRKWFA